MRKWIAFIAIGFFSVCARAEVISLNQFSGLNSDDSPITLQEGQTPDSENVVTDDGYGLKGRKGFIRYSTETVASGLWEFPLSNGTRYLITRSGGYLKATTDGNFTVTIGTVPTDRVIACATLGDKFFYSDTLNGLKYWTGSAIVASTPSMTFSMLATWKGRLVGAGKPGSERIIFLSEYLDGTDFALVTNPAETDPAQITVSGALDENIQAIYSSFQDKLMWFKKNSFGGLYGSRRSNFTNRTFSDKIGVASVETIQDCDGKLRWLGNNRKVYEFDGATFGPINDQVDDIFSDVSQGDSNTRSTTLTLEDDFSPGISSNTETSVSPGSVVLSTQAMSPFVDTTQDNFSGGYGTNITSTIVNGSIILSTENATPGSVVNDSGSDIYNMGNYLLSQSFRIISTYSYVNSIQFDVASIDGSGCTPTVSLRDNNGGVPGSTLISASMPGSVGWQTATFGTLTTIIPNTTYWASIGGCSISNSLGLNSSNANTYPYGIGYAEGGFTGPLAYDFNFKINFSGGHVYYSSGSYVSRSFDVGTTTNTWIWNWNTFNASGSIPSGTSVTYRTQTSLDGINWNNPLVVATGSVPTSSVQRYVRYLSTFTTSDISTSPVLSDVIINVTGKRKISGTYVSPAIDMGSGVTALGSFSISNTKTGGSITYGFQTSTNSSSSLFLSTGWIPITSGNTSTDSVRRYAAFQASFSATNVSLATASLSLDAATFNWSEGSNIKASSGYIDQRYWIGCAISSTSNNKVLVYDKNRQWQRYSGYIPEVMGMYNSRLYVGNTHGVFLSEQSYSDNGTPITSYYTVKTLAPSNLDLYSKFVELRFTTDNSDSALIPTFQIDEGGTDYSLGSMAMNQKAGIQNLKFPFSTSEVQQGKFINMKFSVTGSSFWRLLNGNLYYDKDVVAD